MAVPSNYAALVTAIDAILTTYGLSLFQVFGGRSTQPSLRELISLRWKLFSMTTPANYATLIAEIDVVIESYGLSLQEVFGGRSTQPTLQELIDLRYELFEVDGGGGTGTSAFRSSAVLTRAANTTTYGVNDVIFGAFELTNIGNSGGIIALTDIRFLMNITYLPSGIGNLRLFLYDVTPPSAVADNGAFSVPSGDRASLLTPSGISLGTPALATGGGSLVLSLAKVNQFLKLSGTSLFGYLVTEGAWVPTANSETATLTVMAVEV